MSSKFLERIEEIREGAPPRLGFGTTRPPKLPGMALVIDVGDRGAAAITTAAALEPDAIIMASRYGKQVPGPDAEAASSVIGAIGDAKISWGGYDGGHDSDTLLAVQDQRMSDAAAKSWQEAGADLIVFTMENTGLSAVTNKDMARVLAVDLKTPPEDLRDINRLPVDAVLVSLVGDPTLWALQDLADLARVSGRVGKHLLLQVFGIPAAEALETLRDAGVIGLVVKLSAGEELIKGLKESLLNMSRPGADSRSRSAAILPGSVYADRRPAPAEPEPDDD